MSTNDVLRLDITMDQPARLKPHQLFVLFLT